MTNDTSPSHSCGARPATRHYGTQFVGICNEPAGHTGCHVAKHRDGTRTGFHYAEPGSDAEHQVEQLLNRAAQLAAWHVVQEQRRTRRLAGTLRS